MKQEEDKYDFSVRWLPFLIRPDIPMEGIPKEKESKDNPFFSNSPPWKQLGAEHGIDFTSKCNVLPNTLQAHALIHHIHNKENNKQQNDLKEAVFKAYFTDGIAPTGEQLIKIAEQVGINKETAKCVINDKAKLEAIKKEAAEYMQKGVKEIPHYIINCETAFDEKHKQDTFSQAFARLAQK